MLAKELMVQSTMGATEATGATSLLSWNLLRTASPSGAGVAALAFCNTTPTHKRDRYAQHKLVRRNFVRGATLSEGAT